MGEKTPSRETSSSEALRAQAAFLLSQARSQLSDIRRALESAAGGSASQSRLAAAAAQIAGVAGQLSRALGSSAFPLCAADLMALEGAVQAGATGSELAEAGAQDGAGFGRAQAVTTASAATRAEVKSLERDLFDRHIFDPYLRFSSLEDEAGFRKREADARQYIDTQLARGTPEGDLNAAGGMQGYMLDAHAHGAGDSPDFLPRWNALADKTQRLRAAMHAAGQSTSEYDQNLIASVRRFLKAKGLSDTEIDHRLAGGADPLEAVKPFLASDRDSQSLERQMALAAKSVASPAAVPPAGEAAGAAQLGSSFAAVASKLRTAGVRVSDIAEATPAHGLGVAKPAGKDTQPGLPS